LSTSVRNWPRSRLSARSVATLTPLTSTGAGDGFVETAGGGLHAHLFEFAAQFLEFFFVIGELAAQCF
jgi:hypothetical protein